MTHFLHPLSRCIPLFIALCVPAADALADPAGDPAAREWRFRVFLDDREIGVHDFRVTRAGGSTRVETEASFDVRFLFFTAYRYRHRNVEVWDGAGLSAISATTDANGKAYAVQGERVDGRFVLENGQATADLPGQIMSFGYWNPAILEASRLLNSQTGEYEPVQVVDRGPCGVDYRGTRIPARRFDLIVQDLPISVWYATADNRWLALESVTAGGRTLRYQPLNIPDAWPQ